MGRGWEALCSPFSVSTAEASAGDQEPGRAGPTDGKNKEVEESRPGVPLSQGSLCDMCDTGALGQPMSPHVPGAAWHGLAPAGADILHLPRACTATAPPQGWGAGGVRAPAKCSALSQWDPHPERAPG